MLILMAYDEWNILIPFFCKKMLITLPIMVVFKQNLVVRWCLIFLLMCAKFEGNQIMHAFALYGSFFASMQKKEEKRRK